MLVNRSVHAAQLLATSRKAAFRQGPDRRAALLGMAGFAAGLAGSRAQAAPGVRATVTPFIKHGGCLDLQRRPNGKIAFDSNADPSPTTFHTLSVCDADGSNAIDLRPRLQAAKPGEFAGHIGMPAWSPDSKWLCFQALKPNAPPALKNMGVPGGGSLNEIWICRPDGSEVRKVYTIPDHDPANPGATQSLLMPHFSKDGSKLIFANRKEPSSTSPWGRWVIVVGEFDSDTGEFGNVHEYDPFPDSFYETHGLDGNRLLFTLGTSSDGKAYDNFDIWTMDIDFATRKVLSTKNYTSSPGVWDEHAIPADDNTILWMSTRDNTWTNAPFVLETEFWLMQRVGDEFTQQRLTYFQTPGSAHREAVGSPAFTVPSDAAWRFGSNTEFLGFVITGRPDTSARGTGTIVKVQLDYA